VIELVRKKGFRVIQFDDLPTDEIKVELLNEISAHKILVILVNERMCEKDVEKNIV
jgi:hypothetical protein